MEDGLVIEGLSLIMIGSKIDKIYFQLKQINDFILQFSNTDKSIRINNQCHSNTNKTNMIRLIRNQLNRSIKSSFQLKIRLHKFL
jgi:organic radical activating enzyme